MKLYENLNAWLRVWQSRGYHFTGLMHRYLGNVYGSTWEYEKAIDDFTRAIEINPGFAQAYLDRGILYWRELDHPRRAVIDLTTALNLNPDLSEARFNRAIAYQELREYENAVNEFKAYLAVGKHPHWREHAEKMIQELSEWVPKIKNIH